MRRAACVAPALLALLLSACSSEDGEPTKEADAKPASTSSTASKPLDLRLPKTADYLIPETSGKGTQEIDSFVSKKDVYTVHVRCDGKGKVFLRSESSDPVRVKCGGPVSIGYAFVDKGDEQSLTVSPDNEKTTWALAILDGKQKLAS
ncbi:hypothetical protein OG244_21650 [Streptomyces brevispora]|uniref:hypothetical protein n=1 Tax=Streptomyces brevispora TaxID=887462 RepID=UPI002E2FC740|nr:hypothetical protein [Streptomyces brevispora]